MEKHSKRYRSALQVADLSKEYSLTEAVEIVSKFPKTKFNETVALSFRLGVDPTHGDQMVRGTTPLPHGTGKKVRVLVFTENPEAALAAGADFAGIKDLMEKITAGWLEFDVAIATTAAMREVRSIARVLGPKGLMPNPKSGTVTDNVEQAIREVKAGRVEFKMDKAANLAVVVGKRSFTTQQLVENAQTALGAVGRARPANFRGRFILSATIAASMSPGVRLSPAEYNKI